MLMLDELIIFSKIMATIASDNKERKKYRGRV